jgi:hypothetical protein
MPSRHSRAKYLESQHFTWDAIRRPWYKSLLKREGVLMFENTLRENIRNMSIGLGLSVVVIGAALAVAFA